MINPSPTWSHQGEEGSEAGLVGGAGAELHSRGTQSSLMETLKASSPSFLTRQISPSACWILLSSAYMRLSSLGSRRKFSNRCAEAFGYGNNDRH